MCGSPSDALPAGTTPCGRLRTNNTHSTIVVINVHKRFNSFYARQLYRQVLLRARISYGNSVRLSVRPSVWGDTTRYRNKPRWDRDSGFSPYGSPGSLVSNEVSWYSWVRRFLSNESIKEGYPLRNRNSTTIGSCSVRTVADRHRLAEHRNKHCWRAFWRYQHRWLWTTSNLKNRGF